MCARWRGSEKQGHAATRSFLISRPLPVPQHASCQGSNNIDTGPAAHLLCKRDPGRISANHPPSSRLTSPARCGSRITNAPFYWRNESEQPIQRKIGIWLMIAFLNGGAAHKCQHPLQLAPCSLAKTVLLRQFYDARQGIDDMPATPTAQY